ncbi:hypothetical protein BO70DRAFT_387880 [Aspergillus heteromorphus CBS 117.55]|uniref:THO complex subunit 2 n=1 Tax=Aspergillus heteromorphus CBS 117.55 TaxID=1448321 RepID=A0A317W0H6_9EURO|nr:uncharacterized protein BO70DRAFT_387880 [Aspergillus heteromorphus CBS 117.55]PWY79111.1 hypothetical protein BO70DRAFT_387880 [Aspergillus heteromorphus CBS 117.55]
MAPPKVFITGATGYIGGDTFYNVHQAHPDWHYSVLVRNKDKAAQLSSKYPDVRVVVGDLDSADILEEEVRKADIVFHCADCDSVAGAEAIAKGAAHHTPERPVWWIHTSGTGILTVEDFRSNTWGLERAKQHDDWDGVDELLNLPADSFHRNVDEIVINAGKRAPDAVKIAIVCPPTIYGLGRGPGNQKSLQAYWLAAAVLKHKKGLQVGEGKNIWHQIHVQDLSDLYLLLGDAAAAGGGKATWNDKGYYLAENGPFCWGDIQRAVAQTAYEKKLIPSPEVEPLTDAQVTEVNQFGLYAWGSSSRGFSYRGKKLLGWAPHRPSLKELIPEIVDIEAKELGLANGGAGGKRKRGDRSWSGDSTNDTQRPSPHRPTNLNMAQHNYGPQSRDFSDARGRGRRQPNRGGRNSMGGMGRRPSSDGQNAPGGRRDNAMSPPSMTPAKDAPDSSQTNGLQSTTNQTKPPSSPSPSPAFSQSQSHQPSPAPTPTPAPPPPAQMSAPIRPPAGPPPPYEYEYVTQNAIDEWATTGRKGLIDSGVQVRDAQDASALASIFQELIRSALYGRLPPGDAGAAVKDIIGEDVAAEDADMDTEGPSTTLLDTRSLFLDTLSILTDSDTSNPALRPLLDTQLLQSLGLTNLLYRQSNYNLLREESEGNKGAPYNEVVEDTFEKVKAMVGAFDMDVGRVLDVTLDVFAAVLVKHSWWPKGDAFRNNDGSSRDSGLPIWALPDSTVMQTSDEGRAEAMRQNEPRDHEFWNRIGRRPVSKEELQQILPESNNLSEEEKDGSRVAAQLLGFKLRFYSSRARAKSDVLPDNLIYLAALLIKVGFISLRDLYPHLWRPDDSMDALKDEKNKEKAERERAARPGGGINALMMAGALSDDTLPIPRMRESETRSATPGKDQDADKSTGPKTEEDELPEPLLAIGALPESLFILSKFPWLMDVYPELPEFIHRILHHCLSKELREQKHILSPDQSGAPKGHIRIANAPSRRVLRWAQLDKEDTNDGTDYRFYWDDWTDNVPICQSVDDVFALCSSFLNISGFKIGQDPSLLTKLARIGKDSMSKDDSPQNKARWQDHCKRLLVPSISLTKANPGVVNEIFELVSLFPRETRYNMYAEWNTGQTSRLPDIKAAFDQARAETKDVLKRLSKTNIRPMARALAKIAYANPGIVISVALNQIESYENLIEVVVECARYFTYLGYDILTWVMISSLGQKGRSRRHESKTTSRRLLKSLTSSKLAGQLLIAIAQERFTCIFNETEGAAELKLLGNIFDEIHRVLSQYLDLLRSNLSVEEFDSYVPDLAALVGQYGIQPEVAFWIRRPSIARRAADAEKAQDSAAIAVAAPQTRESTEAPPSKPETDKMETGEDGETTAGEGGQSTDAAMDVDKGKPDTTTPEQATTGTPAPETPLLNPVIQDLHDQVRTALTAETWGVVGLHFYVTFWQLSLYDVHIPQKAYEDEIDRQKRKVVTISNDRSDISMMGTQRKEREKKQITQLQDRILEENKAHLKAYGQTRAKLQKEKDRWFVGMRGKHDSLNVALLEQCFLPRLLLSSIDAFYCFKMLKFLHTTGAPNFRTVGLLDQLFKEQRLTALIFQCTSREADNLGRFLNEVIRDLGRWHADKAVYEKEAFGNRKDLPGFAMTVDPEGKPTTFLEYEDFRRLLYKWHRLLASALKVCLNGGEYMHIRNAISVLKAVVQQFPAVNWIGRDMLASMNSLSQNDERDDVKIPAASLIGDLNRREKKWLLPQAFMIASQPATGRGASATGKPGTPRPASGTPTPLNAAAVDFTPAATNE